MRIIKNGNSPKTYEGKCPFCRCEYEYEGMDVYTEYNLSTLNVYSVICPCCGCRNDANEYYKKITPYDYEIGDFPKYKKWDITCDNFNYYTKNICKDKELLKHITHLDSMFELNEVDKD